MLRCASCPDTAAKAQRKTTSGSEERPEASLAEEEPSAAKEQTGLKQSSTRAADKINVMLNFMLFFPEIGRRTPGGGFEPFARALSGIPSMTLSF
jgi:hypothetical protein